MKHHSSTNRACRLARTLILLVGLMMWGAVPASAKIASMPINIFGPAGSGQFGNTVVTLPNGNIVVTDPGYDAGATADVGAVYLYDGRTRALISTLTGSTAGDTVGFAYVDVTVLSNGNYVVTSRFWDNGAAADAGAVTWCSGTTGCSGAVSASNSLVGSRAGDQVAFGLVTALSNGNYVVNSPHWHNGTMADAGAVTWCNGTGGCTGAVSASNSLVGGAAGDQVGGSIYGNVALSNGNYVVNSPSWDNGAATNAGAVTWCSGTGGCSGAVSASNSLVGSRAGDQVGSDLITTLPNGNYVVSSPNWNYSAGAATWCSGMAGCAGEISNSNSLTGGDGWFVSDRVGTGITVLNNGNYVVRSPSWGAGLETHVGAATWCSGTTGCTGHVSASNSLVGSATYDQVGWEVVALSNGNYVVSSPNWDNGAATNAGAVTWCSGTAGCIGAVSTSNSLVGSTTYDNVGHARALTNGNYVVISHEWDNGAAADAGAVTWCSGTAGCTGAVSASNSLVGSTASDQVGGVSALSNGSYAVSSSQWDNGTAADAGAVTWCSGTAGCTGAVSASNSLVGSTASDQVGFDVTVLTNGNYVVSSFQWDNGTAADAGAVTWCSGTTGCSGAVSTSNSLVGSTANDQVGSSGVTVLINGNYVVSSSSRDNGAATDAGAVTWCSGTGGCTGAVSASNSLVGGAAGDQVGSSFYGNVALNNGNYVVNSPSWDNGAATNAGAVTLCSGTAGCTGAITSGNSVIGTAANGGTSLTYAYDSVNDQLVVGCPADSRVTLFKFMELDHMVYLPLIRR